MKPLLRELALAQKLAKSPILIEFAKNESDIIAKKNGIRELETYRDFFYDKSYFFANVKTKNYFYNNKHNDHKNNQLRYTLNPENPESQWFFIQTKSKDSFFLNVDRDDYADETKETKVWINVVIKDKNKILGLTGTGINLTTFIASSIKSSEAGISNMLIDESGAIQAHVNEDNIDYRSVSKAFVDRKTIFKQMNDKDKKVLIEKMNMLKKSKNQSFVFFTKIKGKKHLLGISYIKEIEWYTISLLDIETVIGRESFIPFGILIIISLLLFFVISFILLKNRVANRIQKLNQTVRDYSIKMKLNLKKESSNDEISNLEVEFKDMISMISHNTTNLENLVLGRTQELMKEKEIAVKALDAEQTAIKQNLNFIDMFSHEYRTPLSVISTSVDLMEKKAEINNNLDFADLANSMRISIKKLIDLFELYLGNKKNKDSIILKQENFNLNTFIDDVIKNSKSLFSQSDILLNKNNINESSIFYGDSNLIKILLINILENSYKYSKNKKIEISISLKDNLSISIKDYGLGIKETDLPFIFEKYFRSESIKTKQGTGVGLYLVNKIVELHKGKIDIISKINEGTEITIKLPI